jgi:hypothetical protein
MDRLLGKNSTIRDAIVNMSRQRDFHAEQANINRTIRQMFEESNERQDGYELVSNIETSNIYRNRTRRIEELFDVQNPQRNNSSSSVVENSRSTQTNEDDYLNNNVVQSDENMNVQDVTNHSYSGSGERNSISENNGDSRELTQNKTTNSNVDETTQSDSTSIENTFNKPEDDNFNYNIEEDEPGADIESIEDIDDVNQDIILSDDSSVGVNIFENIKTFLRNACSSLFDYVCILLDSTKFTNILLIFVLLVLVIGLIYFIFFGTSTIIHEHHYHITRDNTRENTQDTIVNPDLNEESNDGNNGISFTDYIPDVIISIFYKYKNQIINFMRKIIRK